jgi:Cys-tRNA(Pro) deacylase
MKEPEIPITTAIRMLRARTVAFTPHFYTYVEQGVATHAAAALGLPEHEVVKTLVMESSDDAGKKIRLLVLMHADREVSTKQLARLLGVKRVAPVSRTDVERITGYVPGGVSPFGTRSALPVYVESSVLALLRMYVNGGKRGFLVEIDPAVLRELLPITEVSVAVAATASDEGTAG